MTVPVPETAVRVASLVLQTVPEQAPEFDVTVGLGGSALGSFVTTLVIGAILVAVAPDYLDRLLGEVVERPVGSFLYGLLMLVGLLALSVLLVLTIVGILVVVPLLVVASLVWAMGAAVGFLAIADRVLGREDGWVVPLVAAAGANALLALTGIGGLVSFCVGAVGVGAVMRDALE